MNHSLRDLLSGLIDYAGLFPPAALDMRTAARRYADYRESEYRWALGRFVVPVARLDEFEKAVEGILPSGTQERDDFWRLSALGGGDLSSDLNRVAEFNQKHATSDSSAGAATIDAIEIKAVQPADIENAMRLAPANLTPYFETPIGGDPTELIKSVAEEDALFKATAGLHHPLRSVNRLTYAPDSASAMMHGFLNVFLAAAFAQSGMNVDRLVELLEEQSPEAFQFDSGGVTWRDEMIVRGQLRNSRNLLAVAFGSCSFEEPIEDLKKIGLL